MECITRIVANMPHRQRAPANCMYISPYDWNLQNVPRIWLCGYVYNIKPHYEVHAGTIAMNSVQRNLLMVAQGEKVTISRFTSITVALIQKIKVRVFTMEGEVIEGNDGLHEVLADQVLTHGQEVALDSEQKLLVTHITDSHGLSVKQGYFPKPSDEAVEVST